MFDHIVHELRLLYKAGAYPFLQGPSLRAPAVEINGVRILQKEGKKRTVISKEKERKKGEASQPE